MQALVCQPAVAPQLFSAEGVVGVIFLLTVALVLTGAMIAVNSQRLVRAVAGLAICFTGLAGVYYFLLSPFLAMMQLLIYVGAVSIIIAFGIMLAAPEEKTSAGSRHRSPLAGPLACSVAALMFAAMTVLAVRTEWQVFPRRGGGDIKAVGLALLTEHALVFELISLLLLLSILGALVLAYRGRN
ncbi:MAG: NADH-quinone oxidoreductase subunit J [Desulfobulbus sp.]|jgi:NADH-quinone oxidoreductase subunit J|nr:NADH-quinone oxidoreductase subunit J [Desulfobulbus sp.]MBP8814998.1 NADH-quinone oxidoreductase subunit J [Desulfobulbus sp.]MDX9841875.1 NADH-quinone oxidoreductase subunit J [Desulfobulbus sp.]NLB06664.1 NADH-quinone oxidoreductase subunit J [Desulfobulbaceae bacterium]